MNEYQELETVIEEIKPLYFKDKAKFRETYLVYIKKSFPDVDIDDVLAWLEGVIPVGMSYWSHEKDEYNE